MDTGTVMEDEDNGDADADPLEVVEWMEGPPVPNISADAEMRAVERPDHLATGAKGVHRQEFEKGEVIENHQPKHVKDGLAMPNLRGPKPAMEEVMSLPAAPPIQIIPVMPQNSQEMAQQPTSMAPPLPLLFTPTALMQPEVCLPALAPALAVECIALPDPSPPPQLRRSPRLLSPGPSVLPQTTPPPETGLSPSPHASPPPAQLH